MQGCCRHNLIFGNTEVRFRYSIREFIQGEWIVVIFIVAGFKFELLVFCLHSDKKIEIY